MIVILEGVNGGGKTTIANKLKDKLELIPFKPFCEEKSKNKMKIDFKNEYGKINDFWKVPINNYVEDVFAADFLSSLKSNVVLDRSLPSALAYNSVTSDVLKYFNDMFDWWQERLEMGAKGKLLYCWLDVSYDVMKNRLKNRWHPNKKQYMKINRVFSKVFKRLRIPKIKITNEHKDSVAIRMIIDKLNNNG